MHILRRSAAAVFLVFFPGVFSLRAAPPERYLPESTEVLLTINVRRLLDSVPTKQATDKLREALKSQQEVQAEFDRVEFDPLKDLYSLAVAGIGSEGSDRVLMIAHGRFNFAKLIARAEEVRREHGELLKVEQEKGYAYYVVTPPNSDRPIYVGWPDSETIIASPFKPFIVRAFEIQNDKATPSLNRTAADLLARIDNTAAISFFGLGTALKDTPEAAQVQYIIGGLSIGWDVHLDATVALTDKQAAEQFENKVTERIHQAKNMVSVLAHQQKELASAASLLDVIQVSRHGDTVRIHADVTRDMLAKPSQQSALESPSTPRRQPADRPRPQRARQGP
jgi:hypothetical protein